MVSIFIIVKERNRKKLNLSFFFSYFSWSNGNNYLLNKQFCNLMIMLCLNCYIYNLTISHDKSFCQIFAKWQGWTNSKYYKIWVGLHLKYRKCMKVQQLWLSMALRIYFNPRLLSDCQCQSQLSYKRALPKKTQFVQMYCWWHWVFISFGNPAKIVSMMS